VVQGRWLYLQRRDQRRTANRQTMSASGQVNIRADAVFRRNLDAIQRDTRINNRSDAIRLAVHREAQRIRRRQLKSKQK
jgi:hypothetical protein